MNGSQQQRPPKEVKNVFDSLAMSSVEYISESFKVDLDQDDEASDVMGLMPHVDAMAVAAEASTATSVSKQTNTLCIQPTETFEENAYNISGNQVQVSSTGTNVFQNVITYVAIPTSFTPINVGTVPVIETISSVQDTGIAAMPTADPDAAWISADISNKPVTCSVDEFLKAGRKKGSTDVKDVKEEEVEEKSEVTGKLKKLEVRTLFVNFEKRKADMKTLKEKFPSMNVRQLDSLYMKMGCDIDRTVEGLTQKMEAEEQKRLKALEEWRKNFDKSKIIKRVAGKTAISPLTKRAKLDDSGDDTSIGDTNVMDTSSAPVDKIMYPNKTIPSDVRVYKQFFRRVEASDTGSKINAFMERNVVEYPASESEEKARPVKIRNHVRHDYSPCVPRQKSELENASVTDLTGDSSRDQTQIPTDSNQNTQINQQILVQKIDSSSTVQESSSTSTQSQIPVITKVENVVIPVEGSVDNAEKTVNMIGLDDGEDVSCYDNMDDDMDDDRLSTTSSNTRASNSSGGGPIGPKFFRNKISTAAAIHKRAYVSRELSQAWSLGNKKPVAHNPVLEMTGNPATISNSAPLIKGRQRPRVWTASSDAIPVNPGKYRINFGSPVTSHLKIPTDSVESSPAAESFSSSPLGKQIPVTGTDQSSDRTTVLDFFNTSEVEDIAAISNCSRKKANLIINMRPFISMKDLTTRLDRERSLSSTLVSGCKELLQIRANVNRLLAKCQKISSTVMTRISSLTDETNVESSSESTLPSWDQPACLNKELSLKPYQIIGVKWLKLLHSMNLNGILADEMGLGKTVQTIAFLASLMESGDKGPHLVIVPSTTLENWCREFDIWCPSLRVLLYYGSFEERKAMRKEIYESGKNDFNIILTTYSIATNSIEDRTMMKRLDLHYGVFDEAHMLKNMTSQRYRYLMTFKIKRRLLLTGTPLQNNLLELMSLLSFVMPTLFAPRETNEILKRLFQTCSRFRDDKTESKTPNTQSHSYEKQRVLQAKSLLHPFILRRMKCHVLSQLPPKLDVVERVALPPAQRLRYVDLITEMREQLRRNASSQDSASVSMLMQLRKAANHTLLHRHLFTNEMLREMARTLKKKEPSHKKAKEQLIFEDLCGLNDFEIHKICELYKDYIGSHALSKDTIISSSGKLMYLDAALSTMLAAGDRVLLFSQFVIVLDVIEEFLRIKGFRFVRLDGTTPVVDRQELIDKFQTDPDIFIFLMSTRSGGMGINLTAANVVILHDIDYNPHNDRQAEDRCHRVGQSRHVRVIRLLAANTVEEGMYRLACDKLRLEEDITGDFNSPYSCVKHEQDEDDEEENDAEIGSQQRSPCRTNEIKPDEEVELSGAELTDVKELLRQALYPQTESNKVGTSKIDSSAASVKHQLNNSNNKAHLTNVSKETQSSNDNGITVSSDSSVICETIRVDDTEKNVQEKSCDSSSVDVEKGTTSDNQLNTSVIEESANGSSETNTVSAHTNQDVTLRMSIERVEATEERNSANCDRNADSHLDNVTTTETTNSENQSGLTQPDDLLVMVSDERTPSVSLSEVTVDRLQTNVIEESESKTLVNQASEAGFHSEIDSSEPACASESHSKPPDTQENTVDEVCSIQSNNEKGSNPSDISEDSRPLVISEQRGSTDSEEIDVVSET